MGDEKRNDDPRIESQNLTEVLRSFNVDDKDAIEKLANASGCQRRQSDPARTIAWYILYFYCHWLRSHTGIAIGLNKKCPSEPVRNGERGAVLERLSYIRVDML